MHTYHIHTYAQSAKVRTFAVCTTLGNTGAHLAYCAMPSTWAFLYCRGLCTSPGGPPAASSPQGGCRAEGQALPGPKQYPNCGRCGQTVNRTFVYRALHLFFSMKHIDCTSRQSCAPNASVCRKAKLLRVDGSMRKHMPPIPPAPPLRKQRENSKKLQKHHLTLFGKRRCLHTSSDRKGTSVTSRRSCLWRPMQCCFLE